MGKLAQVLGIGVKGSLRVTLDKESYVAGEDVNGTIRLTVVERIECNALTMDAYGEEKMSWKEHRKNPHNNQSKDVTYRQTNEFLKQKSQAYEPGEYVFTFVYRLHHTLPGVFSISNRQADRMYNINVAVKYSLSVSLPVRGNFTADLGAKLPLIVHSLPLASRPIRAVEDSISRPVKFLCCFTKGTCTLSASMDRDVYVTGEEVLISVHIANTSTMEIRSITVKVFEELVVHLSHRESRKGSKVVCKSEFAGVAAGSFVERALSFDLVKTKWRSSTQEPIRPTTTSLFVSWHYIMKINCTFFLAQGVHISFPIVVLGDTLSYSPPSVAVTEATAVECMAIPVVQI